MIHSSKQVQDFKTEFLSRWDHAQDYSVQVAEAMPASEYHFRPTRNVRSFAEILIHIGTAIPYLASQGLPSVKLISYQGTLRDKAAIIAFLRHAYKNVRQVVETTESKVFEQSVRFWAGKASIRKILNLANDHVTHHRGQATIYLRLQEIQPPAYIGW
ncbi:MAG: DinB family protein [Bacteroidota bacterium]